MLMERYDIFEDEKEIDELLEKSRTRSIDYLTKPEMWDDTLDVKKAKIN